MASRKAKVAVAKAKGKAMARAVAKQLDLVPSQPEAAPRGKGKPGKAAGAWSSRTPRSASPA
ncbi:MAG TPA: hypothetical protein VFI16_07400, partial [Anaeromyxobacteraceae bacterium]|nr:hypothetical protein [Anaeromyxobacteraceae bacterium]